MATTIDRYKLIVDTSSATANVGALSGKLKGLGGAGAATALVAVAAAVVAVGVAAVNVGKQFETMQNQLKLVVGSGAELTRTFEALKQVSNRTNSDLQSTVELFTKLKLSTEALGATTDRVLKVTENFQKALVLSGADANTANAAIRQFGQAMASGTVRGDEFVSIVEALGPALAIMARESGQTVGELRRLSQAGELTAEVFFEMVEASEAIEEAFGSLNLTTQQVESRLKNTFTEVIQKINEAGRITETYRGVLGLFTRDLADLFNTSQSLESLNLADIFNEVQSQALNADQALIELQGRLGDTFGITSGFGLFSGGERDAIVEMIETITELKEARQAEFEAKQEQAKADIAEFKRIEELSKPYAALTKEISSVTKAYEGALDPVVKLRNEYAETQALLSKLNDMRGTEIAQHNEVEGAIATTQERLGQLNEEMEKAIVANNGAGSSFEDFYNAVLSQSEETSDGLEFVRRAIAQLTEQFEAGVIGPELYKNALASLQGSLGETGSALDALQVKLDGFADAAAQRVEAAMGQAELAGLTGVERDMREIELAQERILNNAIRSLEAMAATGKISTSQLAESVAQLREQNVETTKLLQNAERIEQANGDRVKQQQRTFAYGWNNAFKSYADDATNAAKQAERLFQKTTSSMEDLFVGFAKTGKFEWKNFVASITETLLQSQIQDLIGSIFGGGNNGGGSSGGLLGSLGSILGLGGGGETNNTDLNSGGLGGMLSGIMGGSSSSMVANGSQAAPFYVIPMGGMGGMGGAANISSITKAFQGSDRINELLGMGGSAAALGQDIAQRYNMDYRAPPNPNETTGLGDMFRKTFAGFFANGGSIPTGSFGIVGEAGPEFVSGPANVTPMGGGNVTYNISAVDAPSFQALVARDPGFIHSVASQGGRQVPRRRR